MWPLRAVVLRAARVQTGNAADADDLAQETLLKAFNAIDNFRLGTDAKAWLFTILRNARIDRLRTVAGREKHVGLDELPAEPEFVAPANERGHDGPWTDPEEILSGFSDAQMIDLLQQVSEDLRWTLLLVDVEGLDHSEAAKILGVPIGTVKSRVHRGHAVLRQTLLPLARERRFLRE